MPRQQQVWREQSRERLELQVLDQSSKHAGITGSTSSPNMVVVSIPPSERNDFWIFLRNCILKKIKLNVRKIFGACHVMTPC